MRAKEIFLNGIVKENPVLVLVLGTCPTLAVTTMAVNGLGMGLATTAVLVCSNIVISLLKRVIPNQVRIPSYIVIISGFVTIVSLLMEAYARELYQDLGLFLSLIVVNCIILGRAEMFAAKNSVFHSMLDGAGMGLGFTLALTLIGSIREIFGSGTWFGLQILPEAISPVTIFLLAPGGFFVFGCMIAVVNFFRRKSDRLVRNACMNCPSIGACQNGREGEF